MVQKLSKCKNKEIDKNKIGELILQKSTYQPLEMNLLNQLINDLGGMVQASSTKQVLLQVLLKRETNNQLKK